MNQWTEAANKEWERYCNDVRALLSTTEADPSEVIEDMRRHIEDEFATAGTKVVTEHDIRRIVNRIGLPDINQISDRPGSNENANVNSQANPQPASTKIKGLGRAANAFIILFGIVLPAAAVLVELTTGICAEAFFDPIPTVWHVLLFLLIPVANIMVYISVKADAVKHYKKLGLLNSMAIGVAFIYTLLFLPILPLSAIAVIVFGLGMCGLAPMLSFIATLMSRKRLRQLSPEPHAERVPNLWLGLAISMLALVAAVLPGVLTQAGIEMATSDSPQTQINGIRLLRAVGNEDRILIACYRRFDVMTDLFTALIMAGDPATPQEVRGVYYRVTGKPFNSVPPPLTGAFGVRSRRRFDFDFDQGDSRVGMQLRGLSLSSSRIDGSIDGDAALGYIEWTIVFRNDHEWQQREARSQIQLPSGGVVSRLTLWVNGEEREAAFASRSQTREAYQSVVRRQRDPVLVTTCGPDRVLVQCFPVPAGGGEMKIRLGITIPLQLTKNDEAVLRIPHFNERNFAVSDATKHSIWIESKQTMGTAAKSLATETPKAGLYALRGDLDDQALLDERGSISVSRTPEVLHVWTKDPVKGSAKIIVQSITPATINPPNRIVFVIDSSSAMEPILTQIADALESIPANIEVALLVAGDTVKELSPTPLHMTAELADQLTKSIHQIKPRGGMDNVPALRRAWDIGAQAPNSVIVWIHAGQPQLFESVETIRQRWERRPDGPKLIEVQAVAGSNKVIESLDGLTQVRSLANTGLVRNDLIGLLENWQGDVPILKMMRKRVNPADKPTEKAKETSSHLARLWAKDETNQLLQRKDDNYLAKAIATATSYQLVTPISGAVVLETQEQYKRAGLEPVDPATVPTIPEPEIWALLIVVVLVLCWIMFRRRVPVKVA